MNQNSFLPSNFLLRPRQMRNLWSLVATDFLSPICWRDKKPPKRTFTKWVCAITPLNQPAIYIER